MEKVNDNNIHTISTKREIKWSEFLDYTNFKAGETNNRALELFIKDFYEKLE